MTAIGGSIESINLEGSEYAVAADAESQRNLGGFENEMQANGNGTGRLIKTRKMWMLDGLQVEIDDSNEGLERLQELANRNDEFAITITYASGITYQGTGQIVAELQASSQSATATISLSGSQTLTQQ